MSGNVKYSAMRIPVSKSKALRNIMILAFSLRVLPLIIWSRWPCIRDECTYLRIADRMIDGEGMTSSAGWLWAPGYPTFVALHQWLFGQGGFVKGTQILLSIGIVYLLYIVSYHTWTSILSIRLSEEGISNPKIEEQVSRNAERISLWSAFLYACSPTQIFFTDSLWSECVYGGLLLLVVYFFQQFLKIKHIRYIFFVGIGVGICILFRGVATYMVPIFLFATIWKSWKDTEAYRSAAILGLVVFLTVLPYSAYISKKFDHFIISDRTLGQMMWLGNNDFTPVTFDSGNGQLSGAHFSTHTKIGRKPCGTKSQPMEREDCQTKNGKVWILNNPTEFLSRIPLRTAQMLNPHSFLTRHLRAGYWRGLPQWVDETIIIWNVLWNLFVLIGGSAVMLLQSRGKQGILLGGILLYHIAAISALAGLTRYRVPLEPLLMIYAGGLLGHFGFASLFKETDKEAIVKTKLLSKSSARNYLSVFVLILLSIEIFWFFPMGWPWWRFW
jgi:hypothetical protein